MSVVELLRAEIRCSNASHHMFDTIQFGIKQPSGNKGETAD